MLAKRLSSIVTVLVIFAIAGGSKTTAQGKPAPAQASPPVVKQEAAKLPTADPCALLSQAEVRNVFPNATIGRRDRAGEEYGIVACMWGSPGGYVRLSVMYSEPNESIADELAGWAIAFVTDLVKEQGALKFVFYQTANNVGDGAMAAIVEKADPQHFLQAGAMLVARRGQQSILLIAPNLAARGREPAYKALVELGGAAAKRL
jgi:hypothetical protein